ncbi:hypothetical protein D3C85_1839220 [compost metagenome]
MGVRLVKTWAYPQLGLGSQHRHFDVVVIMDVEQTRRTDRCPHTTETRTNYQDVLFHF